MMLKIKQIIQGYILWVCYYVCKTYRNKVKVEAAKRIKICESCEFLWKPARNCTICGCFIDIKCKGDYDIDENGISQDGCPAKKW